jgi:hypothetical protein
MADLTDVNSSAERPETPGGSRESDQTGRTGRVKELKRDIELRRYDVDSGAVAEAIIRKLRLVKQGRLALAGDVAGQTQPPGAHLRPR